MSKTNPPPKPSTTKVSPSKTQKAAAKEEAPAYIVIRSSKAPKVSPNSDGGLQYEVGINTEAEIAIRVTENSNGGYFSKEWVPITGIQECLKKYIGSDETFTSTIFKPLFRNSSANNAGFLAATLRHERLLNPVEKKPFQHTACPDWESWLNDAKSKKPSSTATKTG